MGTVQPTKDLEKFFRKKDPWGYETNPADKDRKAILLSELEKLPLPERVLDIGCGHGFITRDLPGQQVIGTDISTNAIEQAIKYSNNTKTQYIACNMYDLPLNPVINQRQFNLILITGVMYKQYIADSNTSIYSIVEKLLAKNGFLVSVHIDQWYKSRFPFPQLRSFTYSYREYIHKMEIYKKI